MELTPIEIMEMDLCVLLGMTIHQMKSSITEEEFLKWQEYMRLNPKHATDIQIAQLTLLASAFMGNKDAEFADFYVHREIEDKVRSIESKEPKQEERTVGLELDMFVRNAYH